MGLGFIGVGLRVSIEALYTFWVVAKELRFSHHEIYGSIDENRILLLQSDLSKFLNITPDYIANIIQLSLGGG